MALLKVTFCKKKRDFVDLVGCITVSILEIIFKEYCLPLKLNRLKNSARVMLSTCCQQVGDTKVTKLNLSIVTQPIF